MIEGGRKRIQLWLREGKWRGRRIMREVVLRWGGRLRLSLQHHRSPQGLLSHTRGQWRRRSSLKWGRRRRRVCYLWRPS